MPQSRAILADRAAQLLATGFGAGLSPRAPGTIGSIEGAIIYFAVANSVPSLPFYCLLNLLIFAAGVWAAGRAAKLLGSKDPRKIVIDEVSGQMIALAPLLGSHSVIGIVLGLALFRALDIFKPFPINRCERLSGGFGVMADDALAGILAAAALWLCRTLRVL
jgi:phosphatidylglycerophosphatase A